MTLPESEAISLVRSTAKSFAERRKLLLDAALEDEEPGLPKTVLDECAQLGWLGALGDESVPSESAAILAALVFELGRRSPALATRLLAHHQARYLLANAAAALDLETTGWLGLPIFTPASPSNRTLFFEGNALTGTLRMVVGGAETASYLTFASQTARAPTEEGVALVTVKRADLPTRTRVETLGLNGLEIFDVTIPATSVTPFAIAAVGLAVHNAQHRALELVLPAYVALSRAVLTECFETAKTFASTRRQGGRLIEDLPQIREKLSLIERSLGLVQLLEGAFLMEPISREPYLVVLRQALLQGTDAGVQILGGTGYVIGSGQERSWRDARQIAALFGTNLGLLL